VLERLFAGKDGAHDGHVLARPAEGLAERLPVPAFHHLGAGHAQAQ
jgi:hypothetical protein